MTDSIPVPQPPLTPEQIAVGKDVEIRRLDARVRELEQRQAWIDTVGPPNHPDDERQWVLAYLSAQEQLAALTQAHRQAVRELNQRKGWQYCKTHEKINANYAWGCPDCVHELRHQLQQAVEALADMKGEVADCVEELQDEVLYPMNEGTMNPVKLDICLTQLTQAIEAIHSKALAAHKEKG